MVEKVKFGHPLTREKGPHHQDHVQMNAHILSDVHVIP
jgi:hypothetical protein